MSENPASADFSEDDEEDIKEEQQEKVELVREDRQRAKVLAKIKTKLSKAIRAAEKSKNDADGIDNWYEAFYLANTYSKAKQLVEGVKRHAITETDIEWIAQELAKIAESSDLGWQLDIVDWLLQENATDVFLRLFELKARRGGGGG